MSNDLCEDEKARINSLEEEIARLQEENAQLSAMFCKKVDECIVLDLENYRLKAEVGKFNQRTEGYDAVIRSADCTIKVLTKDAERYRWLRDGGVPTLCICVGGRPSYIGEVPESTGATLDAAIDAAIKETK